MGQLHLEHMQKSALKYVKGLSADANSWDGRYHKKIRQHCKCVQADRILHKARVTKEKVL